MRKHQTTDGWHSRGYLPHFDVPNVIQFVTFRLHDSIPQHVLNNWRDEMRHEPPPERDRILRRRVELYLDKGYGSCHLRNPQLADMIQRSLLFFDGSRYNLLGWVVMPNHVHLLLKPLNDQLLASILHSLKSYTANEANKLLGNTNQFWHRESFDRYIRDRKHFVSVVSYIENNPVKARLCERPEDWRYGSAWYRTNS